MNKTKHTPGPWESSDNVIYKVARETAQRTRIASEVNSRENAALIAAAPEMFEALKMIYSLQGFKELLESKYSKPLVDDISFQLESILKKARGE